MHGLISMFAVYCVTQSMQKIFNNNMEPHISILKISCNKNIKILDVSGPLLGREETPLCLIQLP